MNLTLISKQNLAKDVTELKFTWTQDTPSYTPGQFLHLLPSDRSHVLRRPISIAQWDAKTRSGSIVIRAMGEGTRLLVKTPIGSTLDALGPIGTGFPIDQLKPASIALLIGGGVGVPALLELAKALHANQHTVTTLLGFQSEANVFYVDAFKRYGEVLIATMDGSVGAQGTVETILPKDRPDVVYACGPVGLHKMVQSAYADHPEVYLSLEERMACGIGACAGCTVKKAKQEGNFKVCHDGPVFRADEVIL